MSTEAEAREALEYALAYSRRVRDPIAVLDAYRDAILAAERERRIGQLVKDAAEKVRPLVEAERAAERVDSATMDFRMQAAERKGWTVEETFSWLVERSQQLDIERERTAALVEAARAVVEPGMTGIEVAKLHALRAAVRAYEEGMSE